MTTKGIPSMHICFDFIPELFAQPQLEKQIFAVKLTGYLSEIYPIAKRFFVVVQFLTFIVWKL
jgi:integrator complex subunit 2